MARQRRPRLLGALILLILLCLLFPLGSFFTGFLPGGKSRAEAVPEPEPRHAAGSLQVTVVRAEDQKPVAGARVIVERLTGGESREESDARGRIRLEGLGAGPVRVEATIDGRTAEAWADPAVTREVLLAVAPEPRRTGRVKGAPARVSLLDDTGHEIAACKTDAHGRYDLPDREGSICAVAEGFAPAVAEGNDLVLREGALVQGKLLGGGAGALSVTGIVASPGADDMLPFRAEWQVGEDGTFRGRLPAGARAFGTYRGLPVKIANGDVALPAPAKVAGVVKRADGSPAGRAVLLFRPLLDADFATPLPGLRVEAEANGEFAATGFAATRYSVEAYAPGCATRVVPEVMVGKGAIEIVLAPGFSIGGFVVDTKGLPVPGAKVRAVGVPEGSDRPVLSATADAHGRFHLAGLGGTSARLRVTAKGYHPTTLDGLDASSTLRVVLQVNG
jgi:hypothetical protein